MFSFDEASTVFHDELSVTIHDVEHSFREYRYIHIGYSTSGRLLVVSFVEREDVIRIISARRATKKVRC